MERLKEDHNKFKEIQKEAESLRLKKLNDYGTTYKEFGFIGILVKLADKYGRIKNLYQKNEKPNNESIRDSLIDLANYATMGVMILDEQNNSK